PRLQPDPIVYQRKLERLLALVASERLNKRFDHRDPSRRSMASNRSVYGSARNASVSCSRMRTLYGCGYFTPTTERSHNTGSPAFAGLDTTASTCTARYFFLPGVLWRRLRTTGRPESVRSTSLTKASYSVVTATPPWSLQTQRLPTVKDALLDIDREAAVEGGAHWDDLPWPFRRPGRVEGRGGARTCNPFGLV